MFYAICVDVSRPASEISQHLLRINKNIDRSRAQKLKR